jgi:hypothetical protein
MTVKEIAKATGRDERSVRRWVSLASDKMSVLADKMTASSPAHPADFSLQETCFIIEIGLGPAAANIYRTNAVHAEQLKASQQPKLSGALVNAMFRMYGQAEGQRRIDFMLGIQPAPVRQPLQIESKSQALPPQVARQVYAVAIKAMQKVNAENTARLQTPELF